MFELHLIASQPGPSGYHDNPDATARLLGVFDTHFFAHEAGRRFLREHPAAWLQVCEPGGQGEDVTA